MEGPHWFFMVCPGSTTKDQIIYQTWSKDCEEGANFKTSFSNNTDEHRNPSSCNGRTSLPANKLVGSVVYCIVGNFRGVQSSLFSRIIDGN